MVNLKREKGSTRKGVDNIILGKRVYVIVKKKEPLSLQTILRSVRKAFSHIYWFVDGRGAASFAFSLSASSCFERNAS